jgi:hypothetical protein
MHAGNCCLHLNQQTDEGSRDLNCLHDLENLLSSSAAHVGTVLLDDLVGVTPTPTKRSRRKENSAAENSSA